MEAESKENVTEVEEIVKDVVDGIGEVNTEVKQLKNEQKERDDRVSNLQLENRLLKGEIASLNEELANAMRRLKEVEEGTHVDKIFCCL